jgi:AcrR family transcriptional regulator
MKLAATTRVDRRGETTAGRILDVALEQFSRLGFERVTMAGIAAAAGVSQPSLHYHFVDKDDLWRRAMLQLRAVIEQEERLLEVAVDASPLALLRLALRLFLRISWDHPALGRIVMLEGMAGGERLEWLDRNLIGVRNRRIARIAAAAIEAGELKPFPPAELVITLQVAAASMTTLAPLMRTGFGIDTSTQTARLRHEEMILEAILGGLATHPGNRNGEER